MMDPQVRRLVELCAAAARRGEPCPSSETIADALGLMSRQQATNVLRRAVEAGLITVRYSANQQRRVVSAPDGSWSTADERASSYRLRGCPAAPPAQAAVPPRRCLGCRRLFQPEHRHRFLCDPCVARNSRVAL